MKIETALGSRGMTDPVFKILRAVEWDEARRLGAFEGSADDLRDGFIHLSDRRQIEGSLARHFAGVRELVLVALDPRRLGDALRWEPSRGGALFPHLYGRLPCDAALWAEPVETSETGGHILPERLRA
jgi:uncharacterized protein (DUF952 family)